MADFQRRPTETVLPDDYPIFPDYVYLADDVFTRYAGPARTTAGVWRERDGIAELRRCELFRHEGARLGDRCLP